MAHSISKGFSDAERGHIAALYWEAFRHKLRIVMGPENRALRFIAEQLNPEYALVARDPRGKVLGIAGFKTHQGALIGGGLRDLARHYGWLSTGWRGPLLALVERDLEEDVLLMDGICVASDARGMGLGTALLEAIKDEATQRGLSSVRLDVIDSNPRARALYERMGFLPVAEQALGPFSPIFGFRRSTTMRWATATGCRNAAN